MDGKEDETQSSQLPQPVTRDVQLTQNQLENLTKDPNYDHMTDEEYMAEMEKKVEYYKQHYPDMYEKAMQWMKMLEHSEVYKNNSGEKDDSTETSGLLKAKDILKNVQFHGLDESDLSSKEVAILDQYIPEWRATLTEM